MTPQKDNGMRYQTYAGARCPVVPLRPPILTIVGHEVFFDSCREQSIGYAIKFCVICFKNILAAPIRSNRNTFEAEALMLPRLCPKLVSQVEPNRSSAEAKQGSFAPADFVHA